MIACRCVNNILLVSLFLFFQIPLHADQVASTHVVTFACVAPEDGEIFKIMNSLYTQAFANAGYEYKMVHMSNRRALAELSSGNVDGDCGRANLGYVKNSKNVIKVDVPLFTIRFYTWYFDKKYVGWKLSDNRGLKPVIGLIRGSVAAEYLLEKYQDFNFVAIDDIDNGIKMLATNRVNVIIAPSILIAYSGYRKQGYSPPDHGELLGEFAIFPMLNIKNAHMSDFIEQKIVSILADPDHPIHEFSNLSIERN